jgi:hypothetical protein
MKEHELPPNHLVSTLMPDSPNWFWDKPALGGVVTWWGQRREQLGRRIFIETVVDQNAEPPRFHDDCGAGIDVRGVRQTRLSIAVFASAQGNQMAIDRIESVESLMELFRQLNSPYSGALCANTKHVSMRATFG